MMLQRLAIHGAPRSGTTWLGEILNSSPHVIYKYQPLFSYAFKSYLDEHATAARIDDFFSAIAGTTDAFLDQSVQRQRGDLPQFAKAEPTHIVYKEVRYHHILPNLLANSDVKLVALVRNPLAVMASWLAAPREFRRDLGWQVADEWRMAPSKNQGRPEEFYGFERWKESARLFHALAQQFPLRVRVVRYSELLEDPPAVTQHLFDFAGLAMGEQTRAFLAESRGEDRADTYAVYRSKRVDDGWKTLLDDSIVAAIRADLAGGDLSCYLDEG